MSDELEAKATHKKGRVRGRRGKMKAVESEEEWEVKGKRLKGKEKKWKGKQKKEAVKGYKYSLHKSILDSFSKQLLTEGESAWPICTGNMT